MAKVLASSSANLELLCSPRLEGLEGLGVACGQVDGVDWVRARRHRRVVRIAWRGARGEEAREGRGGGTEGGAAGVACDGRATPVGG